MTLDLTRTYTQGSYIFEYEGDIYFTCFRGKPRTAKGMYCQDRGEVFVDLYDENILNTYSMLYPEVAEYFSAGFHALFTEVDDHRGFADKNFIVRNISDKSGYFYFAHNTGDFDHLQDEILKLPFYADGSEYKEVENV